MKKVEYKTAIMEYNYSIAKHILKKLKKGNYPWIKVKKFAEIMAVQPCEVGFGDELEYYFETRDKILIAPSDANMRAMCVEAYKKLEKFLA